MNGIWKTTINSALSLAERLASSTETPLDDVAVKACCTVLRQLLDINDED